MELGCIDQIIKSKVQNIHIPITQAWIHSHNPPIMDVFTRLGLWNILHILLGYSQKYFLGFFSADNLNIFLRTP